MRIHQRCCTGLTWGYLFGCRLLVAVSEEFDFGNPRNLFLSWIPSTYQQSTNKTNMSESGTMTNCVTVSYLLFFRRNNFHHHFILFVTVFVHGNILGVIDYGIIDGVHWGQWTFSLHGRSVSCLEEWRGWSLDERQVVEAFVIGGFCWLATTRIRSAGRWIGSQIILAEAHGLT